jgi:hypothetical protein
LNPHIRLTFTISLWTAIFLDLTIFKGRQFRQKRLLDTKCYQKPMNRYLFMPFNSEHTTACKISIVHGELRRYIKRSSARDDYIGIAGLLRQRLNLRGFPFWFLAQAFATAPRYEQRSQLLAIKPQTTDDDVPAIVFATTYSRKLLNSGLSRAIFSHQHMLGPKWKNVKFLTAWKAGFKLGKSLIAFQYPKPIFKPDSTSKYARKSRSTDPVLNCSSTTVKFGNEPAACSNSASQPSTPRTETNSPSHSDDRVRPGLLLGSSRLCDSRN